jgi:transposase
MVWNMILEVPAMGKGFWLTDEQWALIEQHLPYRAAGKRRVDDRRIISGIIHVLQSGCRWRDCPLAYGPSTTVYNRYNRWSQKGIWQYLFAELATALAGAPNEISIDSSHVKAHRCAGGGKGGLLLKPLAAPRADATPRSMP